MLRLHSFKVNLPPVARVSKVQWDDKERKSNPGYWESFLTQVSTHRMVNQLSRAKEVCGAKAV